MKQTRREFIEALVAAGLGLIAGRARAQDAGPLKSLFNGSEAAKMVGEQFLAAFPDERDVAHLTELIAATDEALLREAIRGDFENGRTIKIRGWVFALTEARICAIAAILAST